MVTEIDLTPTATPPARSRLPVVTGIVAVLLLVAGVIVAVAGRGDDGDVDPVTLLGSAPDAARQAGSARMTITMEMRGTGMSMEIEGSGVTDFSTGATSFELSMLGQPFEMRVVDGTMFLRLPEATRPAGVTQSWVAMPVAGGAGYLSFAGPSTVGGILDAVRGMGSDIEELGEDDINGVSARGFRVTVDIEKAIAALPEAQRAEAEASLEQMRAMGMTGFPMEVWLTDDALPVRMNMDLDAGAFTMQMVMDLTDFGVDVDVQAPAEADVVRVSGQQEMQQLFGGAMPMESAAAA